VRSISKESPSIFSCEEGRRINAGSGDDSFCIVPGAPYSASSSGTASDVGAQTIVAGAEFMRPHTVLHTKINRMNLLVNRASLHAGTIGAGSRCACLGPVVQIFDPPSAAARKG